MGYPFYISIDGQKQGKFTGDSNGDGRADKIAGIRFFSETVAPRDAATGHASGKRIHKPILFTKEWDRSSPLLFKALVTNEVLKSVLFEFVRTNADGEEDVHFTVKLTNASIASVKSYLDLTDTSGDSYDAHELEDVELTFQKIELEDIDGKTMAVDDWMKVA
ncbi:MAG TPA: type VI secretion system tube protein TssD [Gaiellaceae bacterium]